MENVKLLHMNLNLEQKTIRALEWLIQILDESKIEYQITGGLAGKIFGSERELHDIDIDVSEKDFPKILPKISEYIIYGPERYKDKKWDIELITLNYNEQEIDISGVDTALISNKERTKWIKYPANFKKVLEFNIYGMNLKIIDLKDFLEYKKELDGEHQLEDIKAVVSFMSR